MKVHEFANNAAAADPTAGLLFGVEFEIENAARMSNRPVGRWRTTEDGSLRNNGIEYLSQPWDWLTVREQVPLLYQAWRQRGWRASVRTGIHVHVSMLGLDVTNVGGVIAAYCILEPVLFRLCGEEREESIYCVPWYRAPDEVTSAAALIAGNWRAITNSCKYSALYLEPLYRYGTLEFRHAPTFAHAPELVLWLKAIKHLVEYGQQRTVEDVLADYHRLGADRFLDEVMRDATPRIRARCEKPVEDIIDDVDALAQAEALVPCTYKVNWQPLALEVEGDGHLNYHQLASRGMDASPRLREQDEDEYYEDDEQPEEIY